MGKCSQTIPPVLQERVDFLKTLDEAYSVLESINRSQVNAQVEISFVNDRIARIEADLAKTEQKAEQFIDLMRNDPALWTLARLRFLQGYEWESAAAVVGVTVGSGRMKVYRFFKALADPETVIADKAVIES